MTKKINLTIIILTLAAFLTTPSKAQAVACSFPLSGNAAISANCAITANSVMGVDDSGDNEEATTNTAVLTIDTSADITITSGDGGTTTLAVGSITVTDGSIIMGTDTQIKLDQPIYFTDADTDGWGADFDYFIATEAGRRRRSLMKSIGLADCDDADPQVAGGDLTTYYQDLDGDTYGNPSVTDSTCSQPGGYVVNNTDCYDADPGTTNAELAYPGSTTCSGSHRGDSSYDYNCSSTATKCGTIHNKSCTSSSFSHPRCVGGAGDKKCGSTTFTYWASGGSFDCGVTGCTCTSPNGFYRSNCSSDGSSCSFTKHWGYCTAVSQSAQTCQ